MKIKNTIKNWCHSRWKYLKLLTSCKNNFTRRVTENVDFLHQVQKDVPPLGRQKPQWTKRKQRKYKINNEKTGNKRSKGKQAWLNQEEAKKVKNKPWEDRKQNSKGDGFCLLGGSTSFCTWWRKSRFSETRRVKLF